SGQHQYSPTAFGRALVVLQAFVLHKRGYIFSGDLWEAREFDKKPAKVPEHLSDDGAAFSLAERRKCEPEVGEAHATKPGMEIVTAPADHFADDHRKLSRQQPEQLQDQPSRNGFEEISKRTSITGRHSLKLARPPECVNLASFRGSCDCD